MFVASKMSRKNIVHTENCSCVSRIKEENKIVYSNITDALQHGKCYCTKCSLLYKKYTEEKQWIDNFMKNRDMILKFDEIGLNVISPYGKWYICQRKENCLSLYHRSTRPNNKKTAIKGYHNQKFTSKSMEELFNYIYNHDMYRKYHPDDVSKPKAPNKKNTPALKGTKRYKKEKNYQKRCQEKLSQVNYRKRIMFLFEKLELAHA